MTKLALSVIMPVYGKDNPQHFEEALHSVFYQSHPANEVLVIADGPLTDALETVLLKWKTFSPTLRIVRLKENQGLSHALNTGIEHAQHEWLARMDADDICKNDRFEKQVRYLQDHPELSLLGSWISEFDQHPQNPTATRKLPEKHTEILRYARWRCPFNHMTVFYRKSIVQKLGGYQNFGAVGDDYELWGRFLMAGYEVANIQESLVYARASSAFFENRRRGWRYFKNELKEINALFKMGLINPLHYLFHVSVKAVVRFSPPTLVRFFYHYIRKFS